MAEYVTKVRTNEGDKQIDYSALANLPSINNNMLINGDFKINQRGSENYIQTNTWTYSVDRWKYIGLMTVTANESGTVTLSKSDNDDATYFSQQLEDIHGAGNFTFSFRVKSISGTMEAYIEGGGGVILTVTKPGIYQVTSSSGAKGVNFRLMGSAATVELQWAKLESGATATAFVSRLRAEELMLCRRYYRDDPVRLVSFQHTNRYAYFSHNYDAMRDIPTVSYAGFSDTLNHTGVVITNTSVTTGENTAKGRITVKTSFAQNDAIANYYYLVSSGRIKLDAEIY